MNKLDIGCDHRSPVLNGRLEYFCETCAPGAAELERIAHGRCPCHGRLICPEGRLVVDHRVFVSEAWWQTEGYVAGRAITGGRWFVVYPLFFGCGRLLLCTEGDVIDLWDYDSVEEAIAAMDASSGEGEPDGWMRHPVTGRRRPGGNRDKEYVRP